MFTLSVRLVTFAATACCWLCLLVCVFFHLVVVLEMFKLNPKTALGMGCFSEERIRTTVVCLPGSSSGSEGILFEF